MRSVWKWMGSVWQQARTLLVEGVGNRKWTAAGPRPWMRDLIAP
jgi:hypothetical protein